VKPDAAIVIVSYRSGEAARTCLDAAIADLGSVRWEAVVVDNASDGNGLAAASLLPNVRLVANPINVGFGAAVNQAARATSAPLLWLLNPDCVVQPDAFAALRRVLEGDPRCAIAAPRLMNVDGTVQESARGEPRALTGLFGRNTWLTRYFPSSRIVRRNLRAAELVASGAESATIDWAMGAAMLVRREAFDEVGGFDERFFLYWEDADLCRRLRDRGWTVRYVPGSRVTHAGGASAKTDPALAARAFHRSAYLYYSLHVVPARWHPLRGLARVALTLRAEWRARRLGS
jgi:GT2 family glycosyltransferase